ncbi:unnamed protein product [Prunus armeniaca]|uniref:Uncharacterized protein n=1 Tax=Prunus armeniaca TaxID=36596 RepID=A0A6J5VMQ7_PRUAR|nr:unnamed protein product [Prunus armeniaca]
MEKDREVHMTVVEPDPKKRRVDSGDIHQHLANPSGLRIHSAFTSFFRTCQLGKIDMALQAMLEATWLQYHAQLKVRGLLQKQSDEIKELGKKNEDSDLLTAKLKSVVVFVPNKSRS